MKFAAFLRGINLGKKNKIAMGELKGLMEGLGFLDVRTLLNSGNVVFEGSGSKEDLAEKIEKAFEEKFGFRSMVIIRTIEEIKKIVESEPFKNEKTGEGVGYYVTFLADRELFNMMDFSQKKTVELMAQVDHEHGKVATTRNWNTVLKIANLPF
jgi:uncharacterized protein (DUF1697 family)